MATFDRISEPSRRSTAARSVNVPPMSIASARGARWSLIMFFLPRGAFRVRLRYVQKSSGVGGRQWPRLAVDARPTEPRVVQSHVPGDDPHTSTSRVRRPDEAFMSWGRSSEHKRMRPAAGCSESCVGRPFVGGQAEKKPGNWSLERPVVAIRPIEEHWSGTERHRLPDCEHCPLKDEPFVLGGLAVMTLGTSSWVKPRGLRMDDRGSFHRTLGQRAKEGPHASWGGSAISHAFVTNTVLCRPPPNPDGSDNPPPPAAIRACMDRLKHDINARNPDAVLALGGPAARTLLQSELGIRVLRNRECQKSPLFDAPVVATFHPAAREPDKLAVMISDVAKLGHVKPPST